MWKTRPDLRLFLPDRIYAGAPFVVTLEVEAREPVDIEWLDIQVNGVEGWSVSAGKNRVSRSHSIVRERFRLTEAAQLEGVRRFEATLTLPADAPPSHEGGAAYVRYTLDAQASIPWWPDARASWQLPVRAVAQAAEARPAIVRVLPADLLDVSLESQRIATSGVVGGLLALRRPMDAPLPVRVSLQEILRLKSRSGYERVRHGRRFDASVTMPVTAGEAVPFRFSIEGLVPSFAAVTLAHEWSLSFSYGGFFSHVEQGVPVQVVESPALGRASATLRPPAIGSSLLAQIVGAVGARLGAQVDGLAMETRVDNGVDAIDVRIEPVGREGGLTVRARLDWPDLGLGLVLGQKSLFAPLGVEAWSSERAWHRTRSWEARERAQAAPFVERFVPVAGDVLALGDDDAAVLEQRVDALDAHTFEAFARQAIDIARASLGALAVVPPPPGVTIDANRARAVAAQAGGTYHPGDARLRGAVGERSFEAAVAFDGARPSAYRAVVAPFQGGPLWIDAARTPDALAALPEAARNVVMQLPGGVTVHVGEERASAFFPPGRDGTLRVDPDAVWRTAQLLAALEGALRPSSGPFR